jgi:hypothetical protein
MDHAHYVYGVMMAMQDNLRVIGEYENVPVQINIDWEQYIRNIYPNINEDNIPNLINALEQREGGADDDDDDDANDDANDDAAADDYDHVGENEDNPIELYDDEDAEYGNFEDEQNEERDNNEEDEHALLEHMFDNQEEVEEEEEDDGDDIIIVPPQTLEESINNGMLFYLDYNPDDQP